MDDFTIKNITVKSGSKLPDNIGVFFMDDKLAGIVNIDTDVYHVFPDAEPDTLYGSDKFMELMKTKMLAEGEA